MEHTCELLIRDADGSAAQTTAGSSRQPNKEVCSPILKWSRWRSGVMVNAEDLSSVREVISMGQAEAPFWGLQRTYCQLGPQTLTRRQGVIDVGTFGALANMKGFDLDAVQHH
ncbi:hypothetical protein H920_16539 [Fukomys damarensis]|uniref:Uncharacterized protein n=1 Tax=Fukomys damarensis TaxID=885580 RepID=A0A091DH00_FUKDA|nr:hypothetical protein H920_16539 [Fukomys damarensis]